MKHKKNLIIILIISFFINLLGAYLDTDPPYSNPSLLTNIYFEIFMMTIIIFVFISTIYFVFQLFKAKYNTSNNKPVY